MKNDCFPEGQACARYVNISKAALQRLPAYLRFLHEKAVKGDENVSASEIAGAMGLNGVQVRKDIAEVSSLPGRPKVGFNVCALVRDIEAFLGFNNSTEAVLVGVGKLGRALLSYNGFESYGLSIIAGFDSDPLVCGGVVGGKAVLPLEKLKSTVSRTHVHIGIITVPAKSAQQVCDIMVDAGIRAVWNFAPVHLNVPSGVAVKNEDMAASLALLSKSLQTANSVKKDKTGEGRV